MAVVHGFRIKQPIDVWSTKERLCLASSVLRSGDQNWVSVSRAIKSFGEPNRPPDWFSQKNCALQYSEFLEKVENPKLSDTAQQDGTPPYFHRRKRGDRGETDTPGDLIARKLTMERIEELKKLIQEQQQKHKRLKSEYEVVRSGQADDRLDEMIKQIEEEKKANEAKTQEHKKWLQEREARLAMLKTMPKATLLALGKTKNLPVRQPVSGENRRNSSQSEQSEHESAVDSPLSEPLSIEVDDVGSPQTATQTESITNPLAPLPTTSPEVSVATLTTLTHTTPSVSTPSTSPLLTSLLKSPTPATPVSPNFTPSLVSPSPQIQEGTVSQGSTKPTSTLQPFFNPSSALATAAARQLAVATAPVSPGTATAGLFASGMGEGLQNRSSSQGSVPHSATSSAPTLSKLLEMPPSIPGKLPPLPVIHSESSSVSTTSVGTSSVTTLPSVSSSVTLLPMPEQPITPEDPTLLHKGTLAERAVTPPKIIFTPPIVAKVEAPVFDLKFAQEIEQGRLDPELQKPFIKDITKSNVSTPEEETVMTNIVVKQEPLEELISDKEMEGINQAEKVTGDDIQIKSEVTTDDTKKELTAELVTTDQPFQSDIKSGVDAPEPEISHTYSIELKEPNALPLPSSPCKSPEVPVTAEDVAELLELESIESSQGVQLAQDIINKDKDITIQQINLEKTATEDTLEASKEETEEDQESKLSDIPSVTDEAEISNDEVVEAEKAEDAEQTEVQVAVDELVNPPVKPLDTEVTESLKPDNKEEDMKITIQDKEELPSSPVPGRVSEITDKPVRKYTRRKGRGRAGRWPYLTAQDEREDSREDKEEDSETDSKPQEMSKPSTPAMPAEASEKVEVLPTPVPRVHGKESKRQVTASNDTAGEDKENPDDTIGSVASPVRKDAFVGKEDIVHKQLDVCEALSPESKPRGPASISDSIPNSPASLYHSDDQESLRDYKVWKKAIMLVWRAAANHKYANVFLHPVTNDVAPGYHTIVCRPMDLSTIKKNIENGVIKTTIEFQRDMMLMFQNAIMYNSSDHDVYHMAIEMQKEVMEHIQDFLATQLMVQTAETKVLRGREREPRDRKSETKNEMRSDAGERNEKDEESNKRKRTVTGGGAEGESKSKKKRIRTDE